MGLISSIFLLAPLALVPLGLRVAARISPQAPGRGTRVAAACALGSFLLPTGPAAALLCAPWLAAGGLLALRGAADLWRRRAARPVDVPAALVAAASLFLAVGGAWLLASRLGLAPMGFAEPIVLLTAVHFHFTGFAGSIIAAAAGRELERRTPRLLGVYRATALGMLAGTPLLAAGFVFSPLLKLVAALLLSAAFSSLAILTLFLIKGSPGRGLLAVSSASILSGMALAAAYAVGEFRGDYWIDLSLMPATHGVLNGAGFCLCGLLGWKARLAPGGDLQA